MHDYVVSILTYLELLLGSLRFSNWFWWWLRRDGKWNVKESLFSDLGDFLFAFNYQQVY